MKPERTKTPFFVFMHLTGVINTGGLVQRMAEAAKMSSRQFLAHFAKPSESFLTKGDKKSQSKWVDDFSEMEAMKPNWENIFAEKSSSGGGKGNPITKIVNLLGWG